MTTRPGPSTERILEAVQHVLIAAVSVVIAVVIVVAFLRVLASDEQPPKVVRQIPAEEYMAFAARFRELLGVLFDEQA